MTLKIFGNRNFLLLMQGKLVSQLGTSLQTFALSLYVLNTYDSATLFASILMIAFIPRIILGPFAGVFVDWFDRKKIITLLDALSGLLVLSLAGLFFLQQSLPLWSVYAITILLSLINTLFTPAVSTVIPVLMPDEDLFQANTWDQMMMTIANILGPIAAGLLMSFTSLGTVLIINGVSFLLSALSETFILLPPAHKKPAKMDFTIFKKDFAEGIFFLKEKPILLKIMLISFILNFALAPVFSVAIPFILKKVMMITDIHFGVFESVFVAASIIGMLVAGTIAKRYSLEKIFIADIFSQPIVLILIAGISSQVFLTQFSGYEMPLILMTFVACCVVIVITIGNIAFGTMLQKIIPKDMLGRVQTLVGTLSMGAMPLGQGLMGVALDYWSPTIPITMSALLLLIMAFYAKASFSDGIIQKSLNSSPEAF